MVVRVRVVDEMGVMIAVRKLWREDSRARGKRKKRQREIDWWAAHFAGVRRAVGQTLPGQTIFCALDPV